MSVAKHSFVLRPMTAEDLAGVCEVERRAHRAPWSPELIRQELDHAWSTAFVCEATLETEALRLAGYIFFWLIHDEVHVLNVATDPDWQRRGVGRRLLTAAEAFGVERGALLSTLEVRRGNAPAIGLYAGLGYVEVGVRRRYYSDNGEDALVMTKSLPVS